MIGPFYRQNSTVRLIFLRRRLQSGKRWILSAHSQNHLIRKYRFDISLIGVVGIDLEHNVVTTYETNDGLTKKTAINASKRTYMVGESVKLPNQDGNYAYATLDNFTGYIWKKS